MRLHFAGNPFSTLPFGKHEFVVELQAQPETGRRAEVSTETQIVFRRATPTVFLVSVRLAKVAASASSRVHREAITRLYYVGWIV